MRALSLNLCASHERPRATRLGEVGAAVKALGVDVLILQEGVRSCWFYDTLHGLADFLGFDIVARSSFGVPFFWEFRVGVLSKFPILSTHAANIEVPQQEWLDSLWVPNRARAVGAVVNAPDLGETALVSVHMASSPATDIDRYEQFMMLMRFVGDLPKTKATVIGGDWNTSKDNPAFVPVHRCGYQVVGQNPDYICVADAAISQTYPVFPSRDVSDHAGVFAEVSA